MASPMVKHNTQVPRLSATVLVFARAPPTAFKVPGNLFKILFIQRSSKSGFMANAHVFPGGVLDEDDKDPAWAKHCAPHPVFPCKKGTIDSLPMRICALRETFEETGLCLVRPVDALPSEDIFSRCHQFPSLDAQRAAQSRSSSAASSFRTTLSNENIHLDPGRLAPWMRWITPEFEAERRRFDTIFYLAVLEKTFDQLTSDPKEVAGSCWMSPMEALHAAAAKEIILPPPTTYILRELESLETIEQVFQHVPSRECQQILAKLVESQDGDSQHHMALPGDPLYPCANNTARTATASSAASDPTRWHRMVRSADRSNMITSIYRPKELHLHREIPHQPSRAKL